MNFTILHKNLGLVKKLARLVVKNLSEEQKKERVWICSNFTATIPCQSMAFLNRIFTMDETILSFHSHENKRMNKQCIKKVSRAQ